MLRLELLVNEQMKTSRHSSKTRSMGIPNRKQETRAIKLMQTVDDREAFYFYEAIGKPTGTSVRNINDFLQTIKTVSLESLAFHLERGDFQSWITKALGDPKLAGNLGNPK